MEELFFENFFKKTPAKSAIFEEKEVEIFHEERNIEPEIIFKKSDSTIDMLILLDQLENEIEKEYSDFADYRCIFNKIRAEFKQNSVNGTLGLLNDLEDLLDLGIR